MSQLLVNPALIIVFVLLTLLTSGTTGPGAMVFGKCLYLDFLHPVAAR